MIIGSLIFKFTIYSQTKKFASDMYFNLGVQEYHKILRVYKGRGKLILNIRESKKIHELQHKESYYNATLQTTKLVEGFLNRKHVWHT